jgi:hypothetical protein
MIAFLQELFPLDGRDPGGLWYLYLVPLAVGIAVVYKTLKVRHVRELPMEAFKLALTILAGFVVAAAALFAMYCGVSAMQS